MEGERDLERVDELDRRLVHRAELRLDLCARENENSL
jgi:hypothetical protein